MASVASPAVTLSDIQLVDYTLETLGSLGELRTQCLRARAQVCIERAKYVTEYLRDFSVPEESAELRRARAMHYSSPIRRPSSSMTAFWPAPPRPSHSALRSIRN